MWRQERDVFVSVFKMGKFSNAHGSLIGYQCIIFMASVQKGVIVADLSPLSLEGATCKLDHWNLSGNHFLLKENVFFPLHLTFPPNGKSGSLPLNYFYTEYSLSWKATRLPGVWNLGVCLAKGANMSRPPWTLGRWSLNGLWFFTRLVCCWRDCVPSVWLHWERALGNLYLVSSGCHSVCLFPLLIFPFAEMS